MRVELLYIRGCQGREPTLRLLEQAIADEGIEATITQIEVTDPRVTGFLGSPTVLINGRDIEPSDMAILPSGLACRSYIDDGARQGFPPHEVIANAVRRAKGPREGGESRPS